MSQMPKYHGLLKSIKKELRVNAGIAVDDYSVKILCEESVLEDEELILSIILLAEEYLSKHEAHRTVVIADDGREALRLGCFNRPKGMHNTTRKVISHNDLDGYGVNVILELGELGYNISNVNNNEVDKCVLNSLKKEYDELYIADLSVTPEVAKQLNHKYRQGLSVHLFDHHKTAEALNEYDWATVDLSGLNSGTSLMYNHMLDKYPDRLHSTPLRQFVELVRDYDTWLWTKSGNLMARDLNDLFSYYKDKSDFVTDMSNHLWCLNPDDDFYFSEEQLEYIELVQSDRDKYIQGKLKEVEIYELPKSYRKSLYNNRDIRVGAVETNGKYNSLLGKAILDTYKDIDMIAMYTFNRTLGLDTSITFSLRSRDTEDVDVALLAHHMGGGGHKNAGGFTISGYKKICTFRDLYS